MPEGQGVPAHRRRPVRVGVRVQVSDGRAAAGQAGRLVVPAPSSRGRARTTQCYAVPVLTLCVGRSLAASR